MVNKMLYESEYDNLLERGASEEELEFFNRRFYDDIRRDDRSAEEHIEIDEEYEQSNSNYGKEIESYIADNITCPICRRRTLRMYYNPSFPVIDLACINPEHNFTDGVKFFQVKSSNGEPFCGKMYINIDDHQIHVGTSVYAETAHSITTDSTQIEKNILFGYICIIYQEIGPNNIILLRDRSLILLPNRTITGENLLYYAYDKANKLITYNDVLFHKIPLLENYIVSKTYTDNYEIIDPPPIFEVIDPPPIFEVIDPPLIFEVIE